MEVAAKSKAPPVCGFCRRGTEVESVCGPLYTSDECNAHKKCMQYSALLVQYKAKKFGGFKKKKVLEEIKRGRLLSCSLCKKKGKGRGRLPSTGASCGCAISTCRKTFHFYCAANNPSIKCCRLEVRDKETQKKNVQYRVFCCEDHHKKYVHADKDHEFSYNGESSDNESGTEEEEQEEDEAADSPDMRNKGGANNSKNIGSSKKRKLKLDEEPSSAEEEESGESGCEEANEKKEESDGEKIEGNEKKKPKKKESATKKQKVEQTADAESKPGVDSSLQLSGVTQSDEGKPPQQDNNALADFYLCIMEGPHLRDKVGDRIRQIVAKQHETVESSVIFWSDHGQSLISSEHMIYFMKDVAQFVFESDTKSLARLVTNPCISDVEKYSHNVRFNEDYMDSELMEHVLVKIRDTIGDFFNRKKGTTGVDFGSAYYLGELNTMFIVLPLTSQLDPENEIRRHILEPCDVFSIEANTQLLDPNRVNLSHAERLDKSKQEREVLFRWLRRHTDDSVKIKIRPKEIILRQKAANSTTCHICTQLQTEARGGSSGNPSNVVMFVVPVNAQIMAYGPYCQAVISAFVEEDLTPHNPVYCVLDVDHLEGISSVADIVPSLPDHLSVDAYCGLDPKICPISCLMLKISMKP